MFEASETVIIVYNPAAGRRRAQLLWRVLDIMVANGLRLDLAETSRPGDAERLARAAAEAGRPMVVAAGGDGTIAEVAAGLAGGRTRLGIIPLGTANVLANELGLPFAPRAVAASLAFQRTRRLWPGIVEGGGQSRLFVQMLGVGFDAQIVENVSLSLKRAIGKGAYVAQLVRELPRYKFAPIRLSIDGEEREAASAIVSKGRLYGGRFLLAPEAVASEPGFSVVTFARTGPGAALMYGAALSLNQIRRAPGFSHVRASKVTFLDGAGRIPAQVDGDAAGLVPSLVRDATYPIDVVVGDGH